MTPPGCSDQSRRLAKGAAKRRFSSMDVRLPIRVVRRGRMSFAGIAVDLVGRHIRHTDPAAITLPRPMRTPAMTMVAAPSQASASTTVSSSVGRPAKIAGVPGSRCGDRHPRS